MPALAPMRRVVSPVVEYLRTEAASGIVLLAATIVALVWANSPVGGSYDDLWHVEVAGSTLHDWISDGLMALFFLVAGLEIRREVLEGELSNRAAATLPVVAAVGGMVVPALIYTAFNAGTPALRGWAIPTATDIAFAVGLIAVLGRRVPLGVRVFLLALAIVDDIGAIIVIALFYGHGFVPLALLGAVAALVAYRLVAQSRAPWPLLVVLGVAVWWLVRESGVHATIAGVAIGLATPGRPGAEHGRAEHLEHNLHPWTTFVVLPLFALANAGIVLSGEAFSEALGSRVAWGVALGLLVGKPIGITLAAYAAVKFGWSRLPASSNWRDILGAAAVAGIGFTVSLFVTTLAFGADEIGREATLGIFAGSIGAGVLGAVLLWRLPDDEAEPEPEAEPGAVTA